MIGEREKLLSLIAEDPFNLLKQRSASRQSAHNIVLLNNFEEIVSFYEDNKREPADDINNIKEFQLYCRLKQIRKSSDMVKVLRDFDYYGLLEGNGIKEMTLDELIHHDPYGLLVDVFEDEWDWDEEPKKVDLSWLAYELIIVNLPLVHSHQDGGCNPEMAALLQDHLCTAVDDEDI